MKIKSSLVLSVLLITSISFAKDNLESKANKLLDEVRKDLVSLSADFEQYETDANNIRSEKSTGKVWLKAPNQFKWEYQLPVPQLIMADGNEVWIYDEDLEQVTIKKQKSKQNPIYVLLNKKLTEDNYSLALIPKEKGKKQKIDWISMTPKMPSEEVKVVWLGIKDKKLSVLKLQNKMDNIVVFKFKNMQRNPDLSEGYFTFEVPKGIDIIRNSAEAGEF